MTVVHSVRRFSDLYATQSAQVIALGGSGLLARFGGSVSLALQHAYPEFALQSALFHGTPHALWSPLTEPSTETVEAFDLVAAAAHVRRYGDMARLDAAALQAAPLPAMATLARKLLAQHQARSPLSSSLSLFSSPSCALPP